MKRLLPFALALGAITTAAAAERPNVVLIIVDDMNDYGFYGGHPDALMPRIDAFKRSAITFRHAYCAAPACVPSRAAMFSGEMPHTNASYLNGSDP